MAFIMSRPHFALVVVDFLLQCHTTKIARFASNSIYQENFLLMFWFIPDWDEPINFDIIQDVEAVCSSERNIPTVN